MGDALIAQVIEHFTMFTRHIIEKEYRIVVGVEKDIQNIVGKLNFIRKFLENAERSQVSDAVVKAWLENLKDVAYDMEDVICKWETGNRKMEIARNADIAVQKRVSFFFTPFSCIKFSRVVHRRDIAITVHNINERLNAIAYESHMFSFNRKDVGGEVIQVRPASSSSIEVQHVCGREEDKSTLLRKLSFESGTQAVKETIQIISIVGLGGFEKTTPAKLVYNCDEVSSHFDQLIWVCVSDPYDEIRVAKAIVESIERSALDAAEISTVVDPFEKSAPHDAAELESIVESVGRNAPEVAELETALQLVKRSLNGKNFLLVLDDVGKCHHRSWEQLECNLKKGAPGSRVLVTTRNESVARMMNSSYIHPLGKLSDQNCWSLFCRIAFNGKTKEEKETLEHVGRRISDKCKGLPLSAYTVGGLMRLTI